MTSRLPTHPYQWDGITDPRALTPVECCATCALPKTHPAHELPDTPADVIAAEQRRLGEH